ncbi:DUF6152 family protein [Microvirga sp. GCM10011540]|uniref:DUF6152 family protein n=1 Tax=Microvirga sp. GCM10011540 TaxID=3317338 RepID=UPI0036166DCA
MRYKLAALCLLGALPLGGVALAHHGWGSYDAARKLTLSSTVQSVEWQNPHVQIVVDDRGKSWDAVLAPPFRMSARGLSEDMLKPGTSITVEGYPSTRVENEMRAERITAGGKTFELR